MPPRQPAGCRRYFWHTPLKLLDEEVLTKQLKLSLEIETDGSNAIIRLNRPETKNTLSINTLKELGESFSILESDAIIQTIVFTGSGDTFASGANLKELKTVNAKNAREFALRGQSLMQKIYNSKKLTIAAINGYCMGGGLDLALSCKKRIAVSNAVFAHPGVNLGIITGWGGTQLLPRLIGESNSLELFMTAKAIDAAEALRIGLIDELGDEVVSNLLELATGK